MKILVIGIGAVGGYFGARLLTSGDCDVTLAARGSTLAAVKRHGLNVQSPNGDLSHYPVKVERLDRLNETFDVVLVCVKNYDLDSLLPHLGSVCHDTTAVISLLNGLDSEALIAGAVGESNTIGGVAFVSSRVESPGNIVHTSEGRIKIGRIDCQKDDRVEAFAEICRSSGIGCTVSIDIELDLWKKLLWNAAFNAVTAVTGLVSKEVLAVPEGETLIRDAMGEILAVAHAHGFAFKSSLIDKWIDRTVSGSAIKTSMHQDAERNRHVEADALNGAIVARARQKGIPVPINETLYSLLKLLNRRAENEIVSLRGLGI